MFSFRFHPELKPELWIWREWSVFEDQGLVYWPLAVAELDEAARFLTSREEWGSAQSVSWWRPCGGSSQLDRNTAFTRAEQLSVRETRSLWNGLGRVWVSRSEDWRPTSSGCPGTVENRGAEPANTTGWSHHSQQWQRRKRYGCEITVINSDKARSWDLACLAVSQNYWKSCHCTQKDALVQFNALSIKGALHWGEVLKNTLPNWAFLKSSPQMGHMKPSQSHDTFYFVKLNKGK